MIENVKKREELLGFARQQSREFEIKSVPKAEVNDEIEKGWNVERKNKHSFRMKRTKKKSDLLESRVWTLMYKMGFDFLSGDGGALLSTSKDSDNGPKSQLDVVAVDDDIAVYVECKSSERKKKDTTFSEKLAKHSSNRKAFADSIGRQFKRPLKRFTSAIMFTWDIILRENDIQRAKEQNVLLFEERDLLYFEALVKHLGPAARYQFLCEVARGHRIPGLKIRIPTIRAKMGDFVCYNFSIRPDYLLKIAYVAHRSKKRAIDVDAYQRMVSKNRLKKIAEYIEDDGIFPTNIVVNIENEKHLQFDLGKNEGDEEGAKFGWLSLTPSYGVAWIIDGQHRLYAYSGHQRASSSFVNVLAFAGLAESKQAQLFVDINSEQKRVKRSLLVELNVKLKWDDPEDEKRAGAIASKVGIMLDEDEDSPLKDRVIFSDVKKTDKRCVTLTSIVAALEKRGFFIHVKKKGLTEYGPFWRDDNLNTLKRTTRIIKFWLGTIASVAEEWWDLGSGEGGGLAMNNGVTICLNVLGSVFEHLRKTYELRPMDDDEVCELLQKYAEALGVYLNTMSNDEKTSFRALQGAAGQGYGTRQCQEALHRTYSDFEPPGLRNWIARKLANNNEKAKQIVDWIEESLKEVILDVLRSEYGESEQQWWFKGIPKIVRTKVDNRINDSDGKAGRRDQNFDLIHYREIAKYNWKLLADLLGYGKKNASKDKQTGWMHEINFVRSIFSHKSKGEDVSFEQLAMLRKYGEWFKGNLEEHGYEVPALWVNQKS